MDEGLSSIILVVDCEPAMRQGLEALLAGQGYRVAVAGDGAEALAQAAALVPDLILLDVKVPDVDGLCRQLRADPALAEVPIVVLASPADRAACLQSLEAGADDYLSGPVDETELLARVNTLIRLNRYRRLWQASGASRESEEPSRVLVEMMPQGVLCCDAGGNIVFANPAARRILGLTPDQIQGQAPAAPQQQMIRQDAPRQHKEVLPATATLRSGEGAQDTVIGVFDPVRQGFRWMSVSTMPLSRPDGDKPHLVYTIFEDVTQRVLAEAALRQSESKLRSLIEQAFDGVVLTDEQGLITEWNRAQERITGLKREEVLGLSLWGAYFQIIPADRSDASFREMIEASQREFFATGQAPWLNQPIEYDIVRPDGARRIIQVVAFPVQTERGFVLGSMIRDVTERIRVQEEMERRNRELAALNEIGQALNSTLDLHEVLTLITGHTNRLLGTQATSVLLYDEERDDLYFAAGSGLGADFLVGQRLPLGQGIAGWVVAHDEPALVPEVSQDPRWLGSFDRGGSFATHSLLCVPLHSKGRVIGALETMNKEGGFGQNDLRLLTALAAPMATAIENARLFEQVRNGRAQLQALSRRLVEVQEAERGHVARELHDETGQALSSLLLSLSMLEQEAGDPQAVRARIAGLEAMVDEMLENLHRLATNLRPATLDFLGLIPALEQYIETFSEQYGIPVEFETVGLTPEDRLPPEVETALYRIVQEALTNVIRHAQATRVDVLLERRDDRVVAIIEDDGMGFDAEAAKQSGRLGLFGMQERAEMLGGRLTIESAAGMGTTVYVEVPYAHSYPDRG